VAVARLRSLELPGKVGHIDQPLGARFEVAQLHLPRVQLVTDDNGEVGALTGRPVQLSGKLALGQVGP
jgi:hypothetical protein